MITKNKSVTTKHSTIQVSPLSLSHFYPKGTVYFYGYPSGEEDGFTNLDSPMSEEAIAARVNSCLGEHMYAVNFYNSLPHAVSSSVHEALQLPAVHPTQIISLPASIDHATLGSARNKYVKEYLLAYTKPKSLVMAQPYVCEDFKAHSLIDTTLSTWLNDKSNMSQYLPEHLLPTQYGTFAGGAALARAADRLQAPVVIKLATSGGGDGVYICRDDKTLKSTVARLKNSTQTIYVEAYIEAVANYGIQFGIPHHDAPVQILGISEQIVTNDGEFLGGKILAKQSKEHRLLSNVVHTLITDTLPFVKNLGWFGVGCFDVLVDSNKNTYIIDANFRMTGMTAYHFMNQNKQIPHRALSFSAEFTGSEHEITRAFQEHVARRKVRIISLTRHETNWKINACILHKTESELGKTIAALHKKDVRSATFLQYI
jgi:hypothetical protein